MQAALTAAPATAQQPKQANGPGLDSRNADIAQQAGHNPTSPFPIKTRPAQPLVAVISQSSMRKQAANTHKEGFCTGLRALPACADGVTGRPNGPAPRDCTSTSGSQCTSHQDSLSLRMMGDSSATHRGARKVSTMALGSSMWVMANR